MGQILVWECEHTGELFREEKDYLSNMRKVKRQLALEERARRQKEDEVARLQPMYQRSTFRALEKWIVDNSALISRFGGSSYGREKAGTLVAVHFSDMTWGEQSCSHNAPLGKPTNWGGRNDPLPKTYPGWHGRIQLWFEDHHSRFTDCLRHIGICTGSGGSCGDSGKTKRHPKGYSLAYEVTLWGEDFPKLVPKSVDLLPGAGWGSTSRTIASIVHDVFHYDRATMRYRLEKFSRLQEKLDLLRKHALGRELTAYCPLWDDDATERRTNYAARAFARDFPYYVDGAFAQYNVGEKLKNERERDWDDVCGFRFLGNMSSLPIVCREPDRFVCYKLGGELKPNSRIVDLNQRLAKLGIKYA